MPSLTDRFELESTFELRGDQPRAMPQHDLGLTHEDPRLVLIDALKREKFMGKIAVSTQQMREKESLKAKGADLVFLPFHDAADRAVERMREAK